MTFEDLEKEVEKDLPIEDGVDLGKESLKIPSLFSKWLKFFNAEKKILLKYKLKYKLIYKEKLAYYRGEADPKVYEEKPLNIKFMKSEIEKFIELDNEIIEIKERIELQEQKVKFIEEVIRSIRDRNYIIKNAIEYIKFISGS